MLRGVFSETGSDAIRLDAPTLFYSSPNGEIWVVDTVVWLRSLKRASVDLLFSDPSYNIKKAEWDTFESQHAYVEWLCSG